MKVDRELLDRATRLKVVATASTGTDHIDKVECVRRGVQVLSIATDFGLLETFTATAECAWMLLLACQRHFRGATASALSDSWSGDRFIGKELSRLTLGVLGVGRLGKMVVQFGKAFCMRVLACEKRMIEIPGVTLVDFDTLLRESDAISIHIHLTPENHHLFDDNAFHRMKQGAVLINTSRGDIVDEAALLRALESGRLAAYGADVIHNEWQPQASSLIAYARTHENVVLTPHIGGKTLHGIGAAREFMARKLAHFLKTGEVLSFPLAR